MVLAVSLVYLSGEEGGNLSCSNDFTCFPRVEEGGMGGRHPVVLGRVISVARQWRCKVCTCPLKNVGNV